MVCLICKTNIYMMNNENRLLDDICKILDSIYIWQMNIELELYFGKYLDIFHLTLIFWNNIWSCLWICHKNVLNTNEISFTMHVHFLCTDIEWHIFILSLIVSKLPKNFYLTLILNSGPYGWLANTFPPPFSFFLPPPPFF